MPSDPIGLMDSGVGGLTVLKEVQRLLPTENTVFLGDQARLPYGPRSVAEVTTFTRQIAAYLRQQANIKMLVIACNTATAAALTTMQAELPIPVVGVITPGAQAAVKVTKNHRIGVIATAGTVKSDQYRQKILAADSENTVISVACPDLVTLAEANDLTSSHAQKVVDDSLAPFKGQNIDTLILGCTHFPLLKAAIQTAIGPDVLLVDPGAATAEVARQLLVQDQLLNSTVTAGTADYFTTGDVSKFNELASQWLDVAPVKVAHLPVKTLELTATEV
ncbi:glutamate racemase [Levilactobacillus enshiensis]|uniref:glutamate racemase n=1 Tax=Levilactobacillus enshiensis TaxID=2590213 RepID=UPI00117A0D39|nr:glutamate racemase [Levilactobacillus enshiensis]